MSYFLGIETSFNNTGICLAKDDDSLLEINSYTEGRHQETLFLFVQNALRYYNIQPKDLVGIGVSIGPGMFTSLRVGLACAKSISLPHKIPIKGIDTFTGLVHTFYKLFPIESLLLPKEELVIPVIDAKRNQVYTVVYKKRERVSEPILISPEEIAERYKEGIFIGSGLKSYPDIFKDKKKINIYFPSVAIVCRLAKEAITRGEIDDVAELIPFYIKEPDIRTNRKSSRNPSKSSCE